MLKLKTLALAALIAIANISAAFAAASKDYTPNDSYDLTATVAVSGTTSSEIDLRGTDLVGIFVPSTFDGTTITFTASPTSGGTFVAVEDGAGAALTLTTTASRFVPISNLAQIAGVRFIKIVTGSSQTTTSTVFTLATRPL